MTLKVFSIFSLEDRLQAKILEVLQPVAGQLVVLTDASLEKVVGDESKFGSSEKEQTRTQRETFVKEQLAEAQVLIAGALSAEQFKAAPVLEWINVPFAGVNRLLTTPEIVDSDVLVTNSAGIMAPALADQVLGYVLSFSRALPEQWQAQQQGRWLPNGDLKLYELAGRTLGIVGYGNIGREVAKRAKAFGMRLVATKTNTQGDYPELDTLWPDSELEALLVESDYVVICAPLTPQTEGLIGRVQLEKMKPTAYLINIARGQLVRENELIEVLQEKRIAGAALDVFEHEPLQSDSPLWSLDNVILTPHSSGNFDGFMQRSIELFCNQLRRYIAHEPLVNVVDKKRGY